MSVVRIDPHAHLYDLYPTQAWCEAAVRNLRAGRDDVALLIVVDREGQDSLDRLRREVPGFATWRDGESGLWGVVEFQGSKLYILRGVQYVAAERIEVLGLGVQRILVDKLPAERYIESIRESGGVPCLPWSPGKWLGKRGEVVRRLLQAHSPTSLTVGDIAIRSSLGPPSLLLRHAIQRGFRMVYGTDPLPITRDTKLVGSFGIELSGISFEDERLGIRRVLSALVDPAVAISRIGARNSGYRAVRRFVEQSLNG